MTNDELKEALVRVQGYVCRLEDENKRLKNNSESLAMAVMLDQTSHDTKQKPLSDEEIEECYWGDGYPDNPRCPKDFARAIEERHGIK